MRDMLSGRYPVVVVALVLLGTPLAGAVETPASATPANTTPANTQRPRMFGFQPREERRYVLEGSGVVLSGEIEEWIIRLEKITPEADGDVAHFRLEYESKRFARRHSFSSPSDMRQVTSRTDVWVNEHGFPLRIDHHSDHPGQIPRRRHVEIELIDAEYEVYNELAIGVRRLKLRVPNEDFIDLELRRGVFLAHDLNPGLLALPLATLAGPDSKTHEYVEFDPLAGVNARTRRTGSNAFRRRRIDIDGLSQTDLGGVKREAIRFHFPGDSRARDHWATSDAKLLRVDGIQRRARTGYIRLLRPTEY